MKYVIKRNSGLKANFKVQVSFSIRLHENDPDDFFQVLFCALDAKILIILHIALVVKQTF